MLIKLTKPQGHIIIKHDDIAEISTISKDLKLSGFINIQEKDRLIQCQKPNYEVGSAAKLSFNTKNTNDKSNIEKVWKIDADDGDLIDEDELLDEIDFKKPDPESLRTCGTTGKRKACKDCSCGLAEELAAEQYGTIAVQAQKSSCGSVSKYIIWILMDV